MKSKEDTIPSLGTRTGIYGICVCSVLTYNEECQVISETQLPMWVLPTSANAAKIDHMEKLSQGAIYQGEERRREIYLPRSPSSPDAHWSKCVP